MRSGCVEYSIFSLVSVCDHEAGLCFSEAWLDEVDPNRFKFRAIKLSKLVCSLTAETPQVVVDDDMLIPLFVPLEERLRVE